MSDLPVSQMAPQSATNDDAVEILAMQLADRAFAVGESGDPWTWRDIAEYVDEHEARATAKLQAENAWLRDALRMAQAIIESRLPERTSALLVIRAALQYGDSNVG